MSITIDVHVSTVFIYTYHRLDVTVNTTSSAVLKLVVSNFSTSSLYLIPGLSSSSEMC